VRGGLQQRRGLPGFHRGVVEVELGHRASLRRVVHWGGGGGRLRLAEWLLRFPADIECPASSAAARCSGRRALPGPCTVSIPSNAKPSCTWTDPCSSSPAPAAARPASSWRRSPT